MIDLFGMWSYFYNSFLGAENEYQQIVTDEKKKAVMSYSALLIPSVLLGSILLIFNWYQSR